MELSVVVGPVTKYQVPILILLILSNQSPVPTAFMNTMQDNRYLTPYDLSRKLGSEYQRKKVLICFVNTPIVC